MPTPRRILIKYRLVTISNYYNHSMPKMCLMVILNLSLILFRKCKFHESKRQWAKRCIGRFERRNKTQRPASKKRKATFFCNQLVNKLKWNLFEKSPWWSFNARVVTQIDGTRHRREILKFLSQLERIGNTEKNLRNEARRWVSKSEYLSIFWGKKTAIFQAKWRRLSRWFRVRYSQQQWYWWEQLK